MSDLRGLLQTVYDDNGRLTPQLVVDAARPKRHPLHNRFEWNNAVAGEAWRVHQAHELIQSVRVTYRDATETDVGASGRAFIAVPVDSGNRIYVYEPAEVVALDPMKRTLVLHEMERGWQDLKRRYGDFSEFVDMVRADLVGVP